MNGGLSHSQEYRERAVSVKNLFAQGDIEFEEGFERGGLEYFVNCRRNEIGRLLEGLRDANESIAVNKKMSLGVPHKTQRLIHELARNTVQEDLSPANAV